MSSTSFVNFWKKMSTCSIFRSSSPRANCMHKIRSGKRFARNCNGNSSPLYNMKTKCPNFDVCYKLRDSRLKVCSNCFWRFENEVLETIEYMECPVCLTKGNVSSLGNVITLCVMCVFHGYINVPCVPMLKEAGLVFTNG